jgi:hypothetical protein
MMNGSGLVSKVRTILKDIGTDPDVSLLTNPHGPNQGRFWQDSEIILALNSAQDIFINYCIQKEKHHFLTELIRNTGLVNSGEPFVFTDPYFHYLSGVVGAGDLKTARIYLGGEGFSYNNVLHWAIAIIGNNLYFIENGNLSQGILYYYTYPVAIASATVLHNFDDYVYTNLIANYAAIILGMKEIQGQRDFKKYKRYLEEISSQPETFAWYVENNDLSIGKVIQRLQNAQQNNGKSQEGT